MPAVNAVRTELATIMPWREMYRREMSCQIIHDSIHEREGWSVEYQLTLDALPVGYGSVAIAGPWRERPAAYEFYVSPPQRRYFFELFECMLRESSALDIEVQSNDWLATCMLQTFADNITSEAILFEDHAVTTHQPLGAVFRMARPEDLPEVSAQRLKWCGVIEVAGEVVASGGVLFHYNPPYGDIYMEVAEPHRQRGYGAYLVQELKRICYAAGRVPAARCNRDNVASRRTLLKAGFAPCGHILKGGIMTSC